MHEINLISPYVVWPFFWRQYWNRKYDYSNSSIIMLSYFLNLSFFPKGYRKDKKSDKRMVLSVWNWPSFIVIEDSPLLLALGLIFTFNEQVHYLLFLRLFWMRSNRWWGFVRKKLNLAPLENSSHQLVGGRYHNLFLR